MLFRPPDKAEEAIAAYDKALALDPDFGFVLNQEGYACAEIGEFDKAIRNFERYAAANPGEANPIDSIAELYFRQGKFHAAKAKYQEALEIRPDFTPSCWGLAYIYTYEENYAEAGHWLKEFIARAPTLFERAEGLWVTACSDYFLGRWEQSWAEFSSLREQFEKVGAAVALAGTNAIMGFLCADRGECDPARRAFQAYSKDITRPIFLFENRANHSLMPMRPRPGRRYFEAGHRGGRPRGSG